MKESDLLDSCKELRDALAAAMRVLMIYIKGPEIFESELHRIGIPDGIGVRADAAIRRAEGENT